MFKILVFLFYCQSLNSGGENECTMSRRIHVHKLNSDINLNNMELN